MALGATATDVSSLILRDVLGMVCGGLIAGLVLVLLSRPLVASLIEGLKPNNTGALVFGGWIMIAVAALAAYAPVGRAAWIQWWRCGTIRRIGVGLSGLGSEAVDQRKIA